MAQMTVGVIPVATTSTNIQDSTISDDGSTVEVAVDLLVDGDLNVVGDITAATIQAANGLNSMGPQTYTTFTVVGGIIIAAS